MKLFICLVLTILLSIPTLINAQLLAFPGAEGYGRFTTGGRSGVIYEITTLEDNSNPGSLRHAIAQTGARTIVFRVSGTIFLKSNLNITKANITIAGQTAPGDGICIAGYPVKIDADNVIIRYIRFRLGDINKVEADAFWGRNNKNVIIDHCSMSWSVDETASFYDNENFTMQWCIISESLYKSVHSKEEHGYGGIWGGQGATFHHNLLAHHSSRNPRFNGSRYSRQPQKEIVDFVNNVIYNWGSNSAYGGEEGNQNIRANYYKYGPATNSSSVRYRIIQPTMDSGTNTKFGKFYVADNFVFDYPDVTADNITLGVQSIGATVKDTVLVSQPFPIAEVTTHSAEEAFELVLQKAGANFPKRDVLDDRIVNETRNGTAQYGATYNGGGKGIIDSQTDVGGWPELKSVPAPIDTDHDGMPDYYEIANGLNINDAEDRNFVDASGYTNLEMYLNGLLDGTVTSVKDEKELPGGYSLEQNYPNPFNPETVISYQMPVAGHVSLKVFDLLGNEVITLVDEFKKPGKYYSEFSIQHSTLSSGVYFYQLRAGNFMQSKKMVLIK